MGNQREEPRPDGDPSGVQGAAAASIVETPLALVKVRRVAHESPRCLACRRPLRLLESVARGHGRRCWRAREGS